MQNHRLSSLKRKMCVHRGRLRILPEADNRVHKPNIVVRDRGWENRVSLALWRPSYAVGRRIAFRGSCQMMTCCCKKHLSLCKLHGKGVCCVMYCTYGRQAAAISGVPHRRVYMAEWEPVVEQSAEEGRLQVKIYCEHE